MKRRRQPTQVPAPRTIAAAATFHVATFLVATSLAASPAQSAPAVSKSATAQSAPLTISVPATSFQLDNGLTVVLHQDARLPRVAVEVRYLVGSSRESKGRTGFAHLFEHLMFEGSANVPEGAFDKWLESAGGTNNGTTDEDYTLYYEDVPAGALELALFLEADRMGTLLNVLDSKTVDGQRDVVKNERRQSYENRPYGKANLLLPELLFPASHPYSWPVIGSMADLTAASEADVRAFFTKYYAPSNAILTIAGDIDVEKTKAMVQKHFGPIAKRPKPDALNVSQPRLDADIGVVVEDNVQLPQLMMAWTSPPLFADGDAELDVIADALTGGRAARLYQRLVVKDQSCAMVYAAQWSAALSSTFVVIARALPGKSLADIQAAIEEEIAAIAKTGPTDVEVRKAVAGFESSFLGSLERNAGRGGKANRLSLYQATFGTPAGFQRDLERYQTMTPAKAKAAAQRVLLAPKVLLNVVPRGATNLATKGAQLRTLAATPAPAAKGGAK